MANGRSGSPDAALHQDRAIYTEYVPHVPPDCEKPQLDTLRFGSGLGICESMYKSNSFVEWDCEGEALFKQRTAPQLLKDADVKWLSNVANRKKACMDLLAQKGKLGWRDTISRWWNSQ
jgi:hypothetical protein